MFSREKGGDWSPVLGGGNIIIKLAAIQHNYIIITLKVHKTVKAV